MTIQADRESHVHDATSGIAMTDSNGKALVCTACGSSRLQQVVEVPNLPAFCNVLLNSVEDARAVTRGDIRLVYCEECAFLFNSAFDDSLLAYSPDYSNSLSCSPSFGSFLQEMSVRLVEKHNLNEKTVLELGCGDGDFLTRLSTLGNNRGFGFDPSYYGPEEVDAGKGVSFKTSYYSSDDAVNPDLVCSRHVLEHVAEPMDFVRLLAEAARGNEADLYIEVPDGKYMIEKPAIWDLIYEHPGYFTDRSLVSIIEKAGLRVTEARPTFLDQFLYVDASAADRPGGSFLDQTTGLDTLDELVSGFRDVFDRTVKRWSDEVVSMAVAGKRVVAWGAGSKGVTFLNLVQGGKIEHIVDINPAKHGRYVPGTGQSVVSPESLVEYQPDLVLLMNGAYESEVTSSLRSLGVNAKVTVVD